MKKTISELEREHKELQELTRALLKGADLVGQKPYYIVQPFMSIVREHSSLINKLDLFGE